MNNLYMLDVETYLEIYELAMKHGKTAGQNMQDEMNEIMAQKQDKIKLIGQTNQDKELLKGNLRENGIYKILDLLDLEKGTK